MKLRYSPASPFARKVLVVAQEIGLGGAIERIPTDAWAADTDLPHDNPLCKVPALITDEGGHLYDSPVICEYLDSLHGGAKLFPPAGEARWTALRRQALADGIMDAALVCRVETTARPAEYRWTAWLDRQRNAITRAVDAFENETGSFSGFFSIGEIALVCALGYLDFRLPDLDWRQGHPSLATWYAAQESRPSVAETKPNG
ncbi:glutathione S-transferase [Telmatospirillum siberiense]|uniref:Glutathione S-transferase n=1 Tax=Telmatospirillum siberiense TaxID=382514 RepID=A0A2N3PPJ2_9PROT|nr:glutathione S-transferase [Telmatospirillum siberiense]PKU22294.1 glutathione S-transferase [Telmatospirillum siberiense]